MNSSITVAKGSCVTLARPPRRTGTDVVILNDRNSWRWAGGVDPWTLPAGMQSLRDCLASALAPSIRARVLTCEGTAGRGSAGRIKDFAPSLNSGAFLLIDGVTWFDDDVEWMLRRHRVSQNALTVVCAAKPLTLEGGSLRNCEPVGVYCCEPDVLDYVDEHGVQDIAAHLIPALQRDGKRVGVVTLRGDTREVYDWESYLTVVSDALKRDNSNAEKAYEKIAPGVWRHRSARVASNARFVGPVLIDRDCRIESGAVIVGPTILGPGCIVEGRARIVRTVAVEGQVFSSRQAVSDRLEVSHTAAKSSELTSTGGSRPDGGEGSPNAASEVVGTAQGTWRPAVLLGTIALLIVISLVITSKVGLIWQAWDQGGLLSAG